MTLCIVSSLLGCCGTRAPIASSERTLKLAAKVGDEAPAIESKKGGKSKKATKTGKKQQELFEGSDE